MQDQTKKITLFVPMMLSLLLLVSGCKEVLYSNLAASEANEMATLLITSGIEVQRNQDKDGNFDILVDETNIAIANAILQNNGLPKTKFKSMDEIFAAEGLVGTPFEEHVRFMFAIEEKLTEQLVSIYGIRDARVTVNIPEKKRFREAVATPKASVILHYEASFEIRAAVPKIKTVVANAVEDLSYEDVAVVIFPASSLQLEIEPSDVTNFGAANAMTDSSRTFVRENTNPIAAIALILLAFSMWLFVRIPVFRRAWVKK